jgi:hypothetical protein
VDGALKVLIFAGFEMNGEKLHLVREDPGLLYLAHSFVEKCVLVVECYS